MSNSISNQNTPNTLAFFSRKFGNKQGRCINCGHSHTVSEFLGSSELNQLTTECQAQLDQAQAMKDASRHAQIQEQYEAKLREREAAHQSQLKAENELRDTLVSQAIKEQKDQLQTENKQLQVQMQLEMIVRLVSVSNLT